MILPVFVFASYAEAFAARVVHVTVDSPCSVSELVSALRQLPGGHILPEQVQVALNRQLVRHDLLIQATDEVALIPPVAGG